MNFTIAEIIFFLIAIEAAILSSYLIYGDVRLMREERWPPPGHRCECTIIMISDFFLFIIGFILSGIVLARWRVSVDPTAVFLFWVFIWANFPSIIWYIRHGNNYNK